MQLRPCPFCKQQPAGVRATRNLAVEAWNGVRDVHMAPKDYARLCDSRAGRAVRRPYQATRPAPKVDVPPTPTPGFAAAAVGMLMGRRAGKGARR